MANNSKGTSRDFYIWHRPLLFGCFQELTTLERKVLILRFGLPSELEDFDALTRPINFRIPRDIKLRLTQFLNVIFGFKTKAPSIQIRKIAARCRQLTPELIEHLKRNNDDLLNLDPKVFEHLIAEFLASQGFTDVALVGSNPRTSADIFATSVVPGIGNKMRIFIEVKRWRQRVGVPVIDRVLGAMLGERERHGWNASMIVSAVGFKKMRKYSKTELELRGVWLKDCNDLLKWLSEYRPTKQGLWLPAPLRDIPRLSDARLKR